ncbi:MAG: hypothetical protein K8F58_09680 [Bauldia sp.]|nr:hypothetical protein [Bauldia sp.]
MDKNSGFAGGELEQAFKDIRNSAARMERMFDEYGGPWRQAFRGLLFWPAWRRPRGA